MATTKPSTHLNSYGTTLILLLQLLPPTSEISPIRRTISEYALSANKWIFDLAIVLIALGSAAAFAALVHRGLLPALSPASLFGALWTVSLLVLVVFPKHNWAIGPSTGGTVHRIASIVAFVCLPIAVLLAARRVFPGQPGWQRLTRWLAITSLLWFGVILSAVGMMLAGGPPWWVLLPLGLVERALALNELLAIAALTVPLLRPSPWT
ncbi:DUF998 domain-containing protein [Amycolatopsis anabasis]|uniref:DUF998 domain-containing protein n=1 Tax=Amycolatopsis anabasis TaxID=1840409 RepID=UPI00131C5DB8|nr:DUF998 domain-containing protein [Amycolatopsis anabasis]